MKVIQGLLSRYAIGFKRRTSALTSPQVYSKRMLPMADWRPDIFDYLDYREFMRDYYTLGKENVSAFSYRYLARIMGFASPNFYKLVMDGKRNLGVESVNKLAAGWKFDEEEHRFLHDLVAYNQADSHDEANVAFARITASQRFRNARRIDSSMFQYLSNWYNPVIRELIVSDDFREDPAWIAQKLRPAITQEQARESLELLFDMGLIERDDEGFIRQNSPSLTTGHEVRSLAIVNYHRQMIQLASESIETVDSQWRDISALTVCVPPELVPELKDRIHAFREVLLDLCDRQESSSGAYQLTIQLFPLTHFPEQDDDDEEPTS